MQSSGRRATRITDFRSDRAPTSIDDIFTGGILERGRDISPFQRRLNVGGWEIVIRGCEVSERSHSHRRTLNAIQ
jgi:hypothetical protein